MLQRGFVVCRRVLAMLPFVGLLACVSNAPAPLETRTPTQSATALVARPGYYIVKKGDTLYSIAHQHERDFRELAEWNGLNDPNVLKAGQEIRVAPLSSTQENNTNVVAVAPSPVIESRPLTGISPVITSTAISETPVAVIPSAGQKTEPKGGRVAYSPQAWKDLQEGDKPPVAASAPAVPSPTVSAAVEAKPTAAASENSDWIWPGTGKVIATFNDSSNKGVDLAGAIGDPVLASGAGKVVYVGSGLRGYGNLVIIKHDNTFLSAYAHNSEILVKEGQSVQKGQKIAALGNSDTDRPKLHFEIRRQGKPVDPMQYLPKR